MRGREYNPLLSIGQEPRVFTVGLLGLKGLS
jgi:hypothetical protein